jgi:hypothetical protein
LRELFCRDGLKYYARIPQKNVRAALAEVEKQRAVIEASKPTTHSGKILALELDLAARMAAESCKIMLWQQAVAAGAVTHLGIGCSGLWPRARITQPRSLRPLDHSRGAIGKSGIC